MQYCEFNKVIRDPRLIVTISHHRYYCYSARDFVLPIKLFFESDMVSRIIGFLTLVNHLIQITTN